MHKSEIRVRTKQDLTLQKTVKRVATVAASHTHKGITMSIKMLIASAAVVFFTAFSGTSVQAVPITLGDDQYLISTVEGAYNDLLPDLSDTPWFSSVSLARSAVEQAVLGSDVLFSFSAGGQFGIGYTRLTSNGGTAFFYNRQLFDLPFFTTRNTFAVASLVSPPTQVPAPNTLFLILSGMGLMLFAGRLRRA